MTSPLPLVLVVAAGRNRVIGGDNRLLWRISSDMRRFRRLTMGKPMVMGRKTFESIGKALPGRETIVVTRDAAFSADGVLAAGSIDDALRLAGEAAARLGAREIVIVGGGEIYRQTIDHADRIEMTEVGLAPDGDTFFPVIDAAVWKETAREAHAKDTEAGDEADFAFVTHVRV